MRFRLDRPYPPTGLSTEQWAKLPVAQVHPEDLIFTQAGVLLEPLLTGVVRDGSDAFPHVVVWEGDQYVEDGHTRIARHVLALGFRPLLVRRFRP